MNPFHCSNSSCTNSKLLILTCKFCKKYSYCSQSCQLQHWDTHHKQVCEQEFRNRIEEIEQVCPFLTDGVILYQKETKGMLSNLNTILERYEKVNIEGRNTSILGKGSYGKVIYMRDKATQKPIAMKIIEKQCVTDPRLLTSLTREIEVHRSLLHDNIIRLYEHCEDERNIYLVMEYAAKGSLFYHVRRTRKLSEKEAFYYFTQACNAVHFLHKHELMHRDIKPENMLITATGQLKLCDFGCCTSSSKDRRDFCGTLEYMAPEVIRQSVYKDRADVWSLGVLLYEMLHGCAPFRSTKEKEVVKQILECKLSFGEEIKEDAKELLKRMLEVDQDQRPCIVELFEMKWTKRMQKEFNIEDRIGKQKEDIIDQGLCIKEMNKNTNEEVEEIKQNIKEVNETIKIEKHIKKDDNTYLIKDRLISNNDNPISIKEEIPSINAENISNDTKIDLESVLSLDSAKYISLHEGKEKLMNKEIDVMEQYSHPASLESDIDEQLIISNPASSIVEDDPDQANDNPYNVNKNTPNEELKHTIFNNQEDFITPNDLKSSLHLSNPIEDSSISNNSEIPIENTADVVEQESKVKESSSLNHKISKIIYSNKSTILTNLQSTNTPHNVTEPSTSITEKSLPRKKVDAMSSSLMKLNIPNKIPLIIAKDDILNEKNSNPVKCESSDIMPIQETKIEDNYVKSKEIEQSSGIDVPIENTNLHEASNINILESDKYLNNNLPPLVNTGLPVENSFDRGQPQLILKSESCSSLDACEKSPHANNPGKSLIANKDFYEVKPQAKFLSIVKPELYEESLSSNNSKIPEELIELFKESSRESIDDSRDEYPVASESYNESILQNNPEQFDNPIDTNKLINSPDPLKSKAEITLVNPKTTVDNLESSDNNSVHKNSSLHESEAIPNKLVDTNEKELVNKDNPITDSYITNDLHNEELKLSSNDVVNLPNKKEPIDNFAVFHKELETNEALLSIDMKSSILRKENSDSETSLVMNKDESKISDRMELSNVESVDELKTKIPLRLLKEDHNDVTKTNKQITSKDDETLIKGDLPTSLIIDKNKFSKEKLKTRLVDPLNKRPVELTKNKSLENSIKDQSKLMSNEYTSLIVNEDSKTKTSIQLTKEQFSIKGPVTQIKGDSSIVIPIELLKQDLPNELNNIVKNSSTNIITSQIKDESLSKTEQVNDTTKLIPNEPPLLLKEEQLIDKLEYEIKDPIVNDYLESEADIINILTEEQENDKSNSLGKKETSKQGNLIQKADLYGSNVSIIKEPLNKTNINFDIGESLTKVDPLVKNPLHVVKNELTSKTNTEESSLAKQKYIKTHTGKVKAPAEENLSSDESQIHYAKDNIDSQSNKPFVSNKPLQRKEKSPVKNLITIPKEKITTVSNEDPSINNTPIIKEESIIQNGRKFKSKNKLISKKEASILTKEESNVNKIVELDDISHTKKLQPIKKQVVNKSYLSLSKGDSSIKRNSQQSKNQYNKRTSPLVKEQNSVKSSLVPSKEEQTVDKKAQPNIKTLHNVNNSSSNEERLCINKPKFSIMKELASARHSTLVKDEPITKPPTSHRESSEYLSKDTSNKTLQPINSISKTIGNPMETSLSSKNEESPFKSSKTKYVIKRHLPLNEDKAMEGIRTKNFITDNINESKSESCNIRQNNFYDKKEEAKHNISSYSYLDASYSKDYYGESGSGCVENTGSSFLDELLKETECKYTPSRKTYGNNTKCMLEEFKTQVTVINKKAAKKNAIITESKQNKNDISQSIIRTKLDSSDINNETELTKHIDTPKLEPLHENTSSQQEQLKTMELEKTVEADVVRNEQVVQKTKKSFFDKIFFSDGL